MKSFIHIFIFVGVQCFAFEPDWSEGFKIPSQGRSNPYEISEAEQPTTITQGYIHAQQYPVSITGVLLPEKLTQRILDNDTRNPLRKMMQGIFKNLAGIQSYRDLFLWVGLHPYPQDKIELENFPVPPQVNPSEHLVGYSRLEKKGVTAFTMSCAACHSSQLFGRVILGMTNRFPRANHFFMRGQKAMQFYNPYLFKTLANATPEELQILNETKNSIKSVGYKMPLALGLDTSLAQVALSLNKREKNPWADKSAYFERHPRPDSLDNAPGDSKPAVWWNLKYKNRWLSDGSVVAGNPIYTNLLWNEIGRGADLKNLESWLSLNDKIITELTTAVFQTKAPRIEEFFPASRIDKSSALRGEQIFETTCSKCHGHYVKNWSQPEFQNASWTEQIKTAEVIYPQPTHVKNVGTDPWRARAMKSLEKLNDLEISKKHGIVIRAQEGYVPPPLVGIWARWPYFHNNSIPSLCALLTPSRLRPQFYYSGEALNPKTDFDFDCNGYPMGNHTPQSWKTAEHRFDATRKGMQNTGHDVDIFIENDREILTNQNKKDLIQFLQTL